MSFDIDLVLDACAHCDSDARTVFEANVTHNLFSMAEAAGIYEACWCPEKLGIECAGGLVELLSKGLLWLQQNESAAQKHSPGNGWGTYEQFVPWVERYRDACIKYPKARIKVSR